MLQTVSGKKEQELEVRMYLVLEKVILGKAYESLMHAM